MADTIQLTQAQREMLETGGASQERLNAGELLLIEEKLLKAYDQVLEYLAARYPDEALTFVRIDNSLSAGAGHSFLFTSARFANKLFMVRAAVKQTQPETWHVQDSYYSLLKHEELNAMACQVLENQGLRAVSKLAANGLYGDDYPPYAALCDTLSPQNRMGVSGWVYLAYTDLTESMQKTIQQKLCELGLCGGFRLMVLQGEITDEVVGWERPDRAKIAAECFLTLPVKDSEVQ